jgi:hypothetical protein
MTASPAWLYYSFGIAVVAVAAYGVALLALGLTTRRAIGWDVDIAHTFMGVAMAGMFVSGWSFGPSTLWELVFAVLAAWFLVRSAHSIQRFGPHVPHESIHAVMSLAMVLMLWFTVAPAPARSTSMAMGLASTTRIDPGLTLVLAFLLLGSAVFTLASPVKGISHHGSRLQYEAAGDAPQRGVATMSGTERVIAAPLLEDLSHVTMCLAMAFMLILMN